MFDPAWLEAVLGGGLAGSSGDARARAATLAVLENGPQAAQRLAVLTFYVKPAAERLVELVAELRRVRLKREADPRGGVRELLQLVCPDRLDPVELAAAATLDDALRRLHLDKGRVAPRKPVAAHLDPETSPGAEPVGILTREAEVLEEMI